MNKNLIRLIGGLVVIFFSVFVILTQVNFLDYRSPKTYDKIDEITLNDFRGLEFFQNTLYGNEHFAYIKTSIDYDFEKDSIRVESFFHPSSSYVYNRKAFSNELLTHELYHFRIKEMYVRMIKSQISKFKKVNKTEIEDLIGKMKIKERQFQIKYDDDTFHSYVLSEQKKYEKSIDSLLTLYSNFKNPKVYIYEK
ncbi:hypothetical protein [Flavobacterium sp. CF136]|uniref:hypothetical protein n=1 Tax=Flavobacterium sp. (strain CF136) TaxID=1144313 RepID=UPI000271B951|nr:hypothetical protein [Flavobacterium sp. CF136]EJL61280.1 hypothetical protein PMI10_03457 [Flavobacterium sp. CF136]